MKINQKRVLALAAYLLLIFLPLLVMFLFPMPSGRQSWRDISVMLGFVGLAMAGVQFVPTARLPFLADVFDLDNLYRVHHLLSVLSVVLVFLHPVILLIYNPNTLLLLNFFTAPWRAQAGILGLLGLILIAITSVLRKEIRLGYNAWHGVHDLLALGIAVFALIHIVKVNYYFSAPAMRAAWVVEALIWIAMTIYLRVVKPLQMKAAPYTVAKVTAEAPGTWSLALKPVGHAGMAFKAGQVAWLNINTSPFTLHRNPFSLAGSARKPGELQFAIKNLGDFSASIGSLKGGETVYVDGPYGTLSLDWESPRAGMVLLAGGIGIAPVMSILRTLADDGDKRPLFCFYGNYDESNIPFEKELDQLKKKLNLTLVHVLEKPSKQYKGEKGYISRELLEREIPSDLRHKLHYFICGPVPMIHAMERILQAMQVPHKHVTSEKYEMA